MEKSKTKPCQLKIDYALLKAEHDGLKNSFQLIKQNYEREKNRVDGLIHILQITNKR